MLSILPDQADICCVWELESGEEIQMHAKGKFENTRFRSSVQMRLQNEFAWETMCHIPLESAAST